MYLKEDSLVTWNKIEAKNMTINHSKREVVLRPKNGIKLGFFNFGQKSPEIGKNWCNWS